MRFELELDKVGKRFGDIVALEDIDLTVPRGSFVCVVGASGSGKSTLMSLVAGLISPTTGAVRLDGYPVIAPGPDRGLVLQSGAVFPWRTVERNLAFGLELLPQLSKAERAQRVTHYLTATGLSTYRRTLPKHLSGGQRQRVAIARALIVEPEVLLLDEPFGALDVQTKEDMQLLIRQVWRDTKTTVLMVTHDVEEAIFLSQRVIVLASHPGRIAADLEVPLGNHRELTVKRETSFLQLRAKVEDLVRKFHSDSTDRG